MDLVSDQASILSSCQLVEHQRSILDCHFFPVGWLGACQRCSNGSLPLVGESIVLLLNALHSQMPMTALLEIDLYWRESSESEAWDQSCCEKQLLQQFLGLIEPSETADLGAGSNELLSLKVQSRSEENHPASC